MLFCRYFPEIWPVCPPWWPLSIWANCARIKNKFSLNRVDPKTREVNKTLSRTYNWKYMFYNRKTGNNCERKWTEFKKKQGWWGWTFYNCSFPNLSSIIFYCPQSSVYAAQAVVSEDGIHMVPFQFDLIQLLPKCQQVELFFLTFSTGITRVWVSKQQPMKI